MRVPEGFGRPGRTKQITAPFDWLYALATSHRRALPDFLIIGAQKAGTTSLCSYLFQHPDIQPPRRKEVHFFDSPEYSLGSGWYQAHFPPRDRVVMTGEASPYYLSHPHVPRRVHELLPEVRLIVLLRDPVERALSHYHHQVRHGREPLPFEAAIAAEPERLDGEFDRMLADEHYYSEAYWGYSYVTRGLYAQQLNRWAEYFPLDSMLVLDSHDLFTDPAGIHMATLDFLGLKPKPLANYAKQNAGSYEELTGSARQRLYSQFEDDVAELETMLGRRTDWNPSV